MREALKDRHQGFSRFVSCSSRPCSYVIVMCHMRKYPDSNCVFRLLKRGLVIIEHGERPDHFMIVRPASLAGSDFRGWEGCCNVGMSGTSLSTNAPPAMLEPCKKGWLVDISVAAAPGPGPVWLHEEFAKVEDAIDAIETRFFGDRVDSHKNSL